MTEGEKHCGLSSFLPMSCRGRAEAFARRLHSRLRSLGSQDGDDPYTSESSWLASNEVSSSVTSLQPRHNSENDIFMDFGIFDTPGSPEEEITESELTRFITNAKDNLHITRIDDCHCPKAAETNFHHANKRNNSVDSDSSDGPYYDPENSDTEHLLNNHVNGLSSVESEHNSEDSNPHEGLANCTNVSDLPSSSECTSTLSLESRHASFSAEDSAICLSKQESFTEPETVSEDQVDSVGPCIMNSGWKLSYEPTKINNNNTFSAIDLETLKHNKVNVQEDLSDIVDGEDESYCSQINVENNLIVECPDVVVNSVEIEELDEIEIKEENEVQQDVLELEVLDDCDLLSKEEILFNLEEISQEECTDSKEETCHQLQQERTDENHLEVKHKRDYEHDSDEQEERIPRVRRCSSLKTGKTPPGTPGRKKIVRFADVLGLDLADVRTFMDEIPKVPTSAYDDLSDVDISLSLSDTSLCSSSLPLDLHHPKPTKILVPLFQQPGGEADFLDRVREQQVCLENAAVQDPIDLSISGTVRVRNLDFHKSVHIRYSTDSWKTFSDLQASYVPNSCDGFSDKFSFTLYMHTLAIGQKVELAVRFHCKGCQYWDSNSGTNYSFQCLPSGFNHTPSYVPITVPDDQWVGAAFYYTPTFTHHDSSMA